MYLSIGNLGVNQHVRRRKDAKFSSQVEIKKTTTNRRTYCLPWFLFQHLLVVPGGGIHNNHIRFAFAGRSWFVPHLQLSQQLKFAFLARTTSGFSRRFPTARILTRTNLWHNEILSFQNFIVLANFTRVDSRRQHSHRSFHSHSYEHGQLRSHECLLMFNEEIHLLRLIIPGFHRRLSPFIVFLLLKTFRLSVLWRDHDHGPVAEIFLHLVTHHM